ncbi:UNVERIFIED_CONTAM: hypothetical protein FKN15_038123 [Acipenser sinensis]
MDSPPHAQTEAGISFHSSLSQPRFYYEFRYTKPRLRFKCYDGVASNESRR